MDERELTKLIPQKETTQKEGPQIEVVNCTSIAGKAALSNEFHAELRALVETKMKEYENQNVVGVQMISALSSLLVEHTLKTNVSLAAVLDNIKYFYNILSKIPVQKYKDTLDKELAAVVAPLGKIN